MGLVVARWGKQGAVHVQYGQQLGRKWPSYGAWRGGPLSNKGSCRWEMANLQALPHLLVMSALLQVCGSLWGLHQSSSESTGALDSGIRPK